MISCTVGPDIKRKPDILIYKYTCAHTPTESKHLKMHLSLHVGEHKAYSPWVIQAGAAGTRRWGHPV